MATIKKAQTGATRQAGTDAQGRPHPIVENIDKKQKVNVKKNIIDKPKTKSKIEIDYENSLKKTAIENAKYNKIKEKTGEIRTQRNPMQPTLASMGFLNKKKSTKKPNKVLEALSKDKNGGTIKKKMKNGGSLSALKASTKRVGPVDPKGAFTKVQKKTLAGAKGKASLTKDKQLGATKMKKK